MDLGIEGKWALVLGASQGIGAAIAHALGVRVRDMPLTAERIEQAINASVN